MSMSLEEAMIKLGAVRSNFAQSLCQQYARFGRLSEKQISWVYKLIDPKPAATPSIVVGIDLMPIVSLFRKAGEKLAKPKLTFIHDGVGFRISTSRDGAWLHVAEPQYGGLYYGKINMADGAWVNGRNACEAVAVFLRDFATDPVRKAAEYGHKTGLCCFCHKGLDNPASTEVGYGPVCARKWGLPHKYAARARASVVPMPAT